ncbi:YdiU family protein [Paenibacillus sp. TRM 82003]|nr:YdiU family protein [Paenibacillus sp. TRM 82003]
MSENKATVDVGWSFDNSYTRLPETFYTLQNPVPVRSPKLAVLNEALAASLGLDVEALQGEAGAATFAGNRIPEGAKPLAQAYAGHQFGHFTMLGDGRAVLLGEHLAPAGERYDIQLKGSGRTPYSRGGDGRAALGPMLREYIISEAMHALGIPTTRSLAVATTGQPVIREEELTGAVLTRVAASHIRVGTFQYAARFGTTDDLRALADYVLARHYPEIPLNDDGRYLSLLRGVVDRQAGLIAKWLLVGFIHGVMNTDNMTVSGETIDYGPCAFMNEYDPATVFSSIDRQGRYAYGHQPAIGVWNLSRFAETLLPLLHDDQDEAIKLAEEALSTFSGAFQLSWSSGMRAKLGLFGEESEDETLVQELLSLMQKYRADYTNTFLALTFDSFDRVPELSGNEEFASWRVRWQARRERQEETAEASHARMRDSNPAVIPRNHRVEEALDAAVNEDDFEVMKRLLGVLAKPYAHTTEQQQEYATTPERTNVPYRTYCGT